MSIRFIVLFDSHPSSSCADSMDFDDSFSFSLSLSLSLSSIRPYHLSLPASLPNDILYPHRANVDKFFLVGQDWYTSMCGGPKKNVTFEVVFTSPAVSLMSCSLECFYMLPSQGYVWNKSDIGEIALCMLQNEHSNKCWKIKESTEIYWPDLLFYSIGN